MLVKGRADVVLNFEYGMNQTIRDLGYSSKIFKIVPLETFDTYSFLHKRNIHLLEPVRQSLKNLKEDGTYQKLIEQYIFNKSTKTMENQNE